MKGKEKGQGLVEFALILLIVAIALIVVVALFWEPIIKAVWPPLMNELEKIMAGDPASVLGLIVSVVILCFLFFRRREQPKQ